jgi:hypothetical protein
METIAIGNLNPIKTYILDWVETQLSILVSPKQANRWELCSFLQVSYMQ